MKFPETFFWAYRPGINSKALSISKYTLSRDTANRHYGPALVGPIDESEWNVYPKGQWPVDAGPEIN